MSALEQELLKSYVIQFYDSILESPESKATAPSVPADTKSAPTPRPAPMVRPDVKAPEPEKVIPPVEPVVATPPTASAEKVEMATVAETNGTAIATDENPGGYLQAFYNEIIEDINAGTHRAKTGKRPEEIHRPQ